MIQVPFTAQFKLLPTMLYKRSEQMHELQKIGAFIYSALISLPNINIAMPGGGQDAGSHTFSNAAMCTAVKPQFGETPAQATVTGFYLVGEYTDGIQIPIAPQAQVQLISCGQTLTGPRSNCLWDSNPNPILTSQAMTLKTMMETAINADLPPSYNHVSVFRLDYQGVIFGDRGLSF